MRPTFSVLNTIRTSASVIETEADKEALLSASKTTRPLTELIRRLICACVGGS